MAGIGLLVIPGERGENTVYVLLDRKHVIQRIDGVSEEGIRRISHEIFNRELRA